MKEGVKSMIRTDALSIGYSGKALIGDCDIRVPEATLSLLVGANGSGKSTLLHTLAGSLPALGGDVLLDGVSLRKMSRKQIARKLSLVYTDKVASGGLTVREIVEMGRHPHTGFLGRLSATDREIVEKAMQDVDISHKADSFLSDTSDGERQKAMIARALAQQTPIMLLDEPTNFLDVASRLEIFGLLRNLVDARKVTVVLSTHDVAAAMPFADNLITILPDDPLPVSIVKSGTDESISRLKSVFADRGITFDAERNDFRIKKEISDNPS